MIKAACSCSSGSKTSVAPFNDSLTAASSAYLASRRSAPMVRADGRCSPVRVAMHVVIRRHAGIVTAVSHAPNAHSWRHADGRNVSVQPADPDTSAAPIAMNSAPTARLR